MEPQPVALVRVMCGQKVVEPPARISHKIRGPARSLFLIISGFLIMSRWLSVLKPPLGLNGCSWLLLVRGNRSRIDLRGNAANHQDRTVLHVDVP